MRSLPNRRAVLAAAGLFTAAPKLAQAQVQSLPLANPTLAARVRQAGVPALGYAVVGPDGLRALEAAGLRRTDRAAPMLSTDPWHVGGVTQAMTAALYARLVEQGRGAWGARLPALFPGVKLDPAWTDVRIEALLAHRAGLSDRALLTPERLRAMRQDPRPVAQQRASFAAEVLAKPPPGQPDALEPSLAGYVIAGAAIERLARADWESAITVGLFRPLGMNDAAFGPPRAEGDEVAPTGHELAPGHVFKPVDASSLADYPPALGPAGRVHLPLGDLAKFARLFLADGAGVLRPDSLVRLARPWSGMGEGGALGWETAERPWADGPVLSAEGSNGLWRATVTIAPAKGLGVLTACNADAGGGAQAAQALSLALVALYTGAAAPAPKPRRRWLPF